MSDPVRPATTQLPVLELHNSSKRREQGGIAFELHIEDFNLYQGEFVALLGESGCGKSTLLDVLALVSRPTASTRFHYHSGTDRYDLNALWIAGDEHGLAMLRRSQFGYVLQTGGLLPFLTVWENIILAMQINGQFEEKYLYDLAERIGVANLLEKKPQYLSGGQRQRVAILRALAHRPRLILADEPTAAVDHQRAHTIVADFGKLARETGATIVMVSHDRALVMPHANRAYGFIVEERSATTICSRCLLIHEEGLE